MSIKNKQQILRTKPIPNNLLSKLIDRVNLLPGNDSLNELQIKSDEISDLLDFFKIRSNYDKANRKTHKARLELNKALDEKPLKFKKYIWGNAKPYINLLKKLNDPEFDLSSFRWKTVEAIKRYEDFRELNEQMRGLASELKYLSNWKDAKIEVNNEQQYIPFEFLTVGAGKVFYEVNEAGIVDFTFDEFSTAIKGIDVRRIRECEICQRIFWAGRIDKTCCSDACANVYHVRGWRDNYKKNKVQINQQGRNNRDQKKNVLRLKEEREMRN